MIAYIQQIVRDLLPRFQLPEQEKLLDVSERFQGLAEELNRLDPRDFLPATQFAFFEARLQVRFLARPHAHQWLNDLYVLKEHEARRLRQNANLTDIRKEHNLAGGVPPELIPAVLQSEMEESVKAIIEIRSRFDSVAEICKRVDDLLESHAGMGSQAVTRSFVFVQNADLRTIIERDYRELSLVLLPAYAWKSAVILAGSILEAILYDLLTCNPARIQAAIQSKKASKKKGGAVRDIAKNTAEDKWDLEHLIATAIDLNLIPVDRGKTIDQALRDYRNFVHPRKEIRAAHPCTEAEAMLAKGALDGVCNHLE
jgi:hypothetical protein